MQLRSVGGLAAESFQSRPTALGFIECMTGGEAYKVLERMLWKWYGRTNDMDYMTLMAQLIRPESQEEWAESILEMTQCRKDGMRASIWQNEKIPMSECNCNKK